MYGSISIYAAFVLTIVAVLLYAVKVFLKNEDITFYAQYVYYLKTAAIVFACISLMRALLTHQFQYYYVYAHTSLDLPLEYLISAFWAGQEGTFLLWAMLAALLGLAVIRLEREYEGPVMLFLLVGQAFLLLFLLLYNPFRLMPQVPMDGYGLNPLLMDPWMVIHPPIIFVGYALLLLPCAYALTGLWRKDYQGWVNKALPWAVFGWLFLGAGIIVGAYWAYKVLGWGGYWGWDPVENASLVPWLTCSALVHGMLVQKVRSSNARSNFFLAIITFVLIIYATFLTRSGILADFSVHAFGETTLNPYMMVYMLFYLLVGLALLVVRYRDIPSGKAKDKWYSRQSTFDYTIILLSLSAIIIILGTSSPIITGIFGDPSSVDISFYNITNAPIVALLALVLAVCPLTRWKDYSPGEIVKGLKGAALFTLLGLAAFAYFLEIRSPLKLVFLGSALLAIGTNGAALYKAFKRGLKFSGGYLAHVGLALMLIGILSTSVLNQNTVLSLKENETKEALGYSFTYMGSNYQEGIDYQELLVTKGDNSYKASPKMYLAGRDQMVMREPYILRSIFRDLYISPLELRVERSGESAILSRGETVTLKGYDVTFLEFNMDSHDNSGEIQVGALLLVGKEDYKEELMPYITHSIHGIETNPVDLPEEGFQLVLETLDASQGQILLRVREEKSAPPETVFVMEVSHKPLVSVLILGSVLLFLGTTLAVWRRFSRNSAV